MPTLRVSRYRSGRRRIGSAAVGGRPQRVSDRGSSPAGRCPRNARVMCRCSGGTRRPSRIVLACQLGQRVERGLGEPQGAEEP